ncbi:uncharacterized protein N7443_004044 [Penicillium atrosanguineum]|uniref:uncharacterized protein n=1 Tax=Penicillium atrosanguineum TaxID=1132637 RepID=UPI0023909C94|nr:uncharacterized protein N7443_004044 [Penicillium atrosanguineum]KAJ5304384.1 hypothetical protein N7443_004044 [Penicillium atrosanguineum]
MGIFKNLIEPGAIVAIFTLGTWINRCERSRATGDPRTPLFKDDSEDENTGENGYGAIEEQPCRPRRVVHSRVLRKFPFLLEIFYWLLIYWVYQGARAISARLIVENESVFQKAEHHAIQILSFERHLDVDIELSVQQFALNKAPWLMDYLAHVYHSHIVIGVVFYVYCYTFMSRNQYQRIRRALALENVIAFVIISLWRCSPPRLLPEEYGFIDVLHKDNSGSAWTHNKFQLTIAAMPSLHLGNSVLIAFCLLNYSPHVLLRIVAPLWPMIMELTVVATANHFVLDTIVGVAVIATAYRFNRMMLGLLPLERVMFRAIRLEKPGES